MRFEQAKFEGAYLVDLEPSEDSRGFFARAFCKEEFGAQGLSTDLSQINISYNTSAHTLRGLHYQADPHGEIKLVRCTKGEIYDVIVDVRPGSPTYLDWVAVELSDKNRRALYIPEGFAHGFQSLCDGSEVLYLMSTQYVPDAARGLRWDDPKIGIDWPAADQRTISDRDQSFALL